MWKDETSCIDFSRSLKANNFWLKHPEAVFDFVHATAGFFPVKLQKDTTYKEVVTVHVIRCCSWDLFSSSLGVTVPSASTTTGTTLAFILYILSGSSFRPLLLQLLILFFFPMLLLFGITTSIATAVFCSLSTTMMSSWLSSTYLSICILNSTIFSGTSHLDLGGSSHTLSRCCYIQCQQNIISCATREYAVPACILLPLCVGLTQRPLCITCSSDAVQSVRTYFYGSDA